MTLRQAKKLVRPWWVRGGYQASVDYSDACPCRMCRAARVVARWVRRSTRTGGTTK